MSKREHEEKMGRRTGKSATVGPYKRDDLAQMLRENQRLPDGISYSPSSREPFVYLGEEGDNGDAESSGGKKDA
jgi:hypothetical protein